MSKSIWITGASSGIGRALAIELARRGHRLGLSARRIEKLSELQDEIVRQFPDSQVAIAEQDVTNLDSNRDVLTTLCRSLGEIDVIIVNAGIGGSGHAGNGEFAAARSVIETNLLGAMATADTAIEYFRQRDYRGQVVGISSIAGIRGLPGSAAYCASKAGLTTYLEAVRAEVDRFGITVTVVAPGYIDTPINAKVKKRPFLISVDDGARRIANVVERRRLHATVPWWPWAPLGLAMRQLPSRLWLRMTAGKTTRRLSARE